jgi:hypothetical protein
MQQEFEDPPVSSTALACCATLACMFTMGVCSCPLCYIKKKVTDFNLRLDATVDDAVRELGINMCEVKIRMNEKETMTPGWRDSKGQQLMGTFSETRGEHTHTYQAEAGPPNGYNVVLIGAPVEQQGNTGRAALPWPPNSVPMMQAVQAVPAVAPDMNRQVDVAEELRKLNDLHSQGILTDAEFADAKAKVLSP